MLRWFQSHKQKIKRNVWVELTQENLFVFMSELNMSLPPIRSQVLQSKLILYSKCSRLGRRRCRGMARPFLWVRELDEPRGPAQVQPWADSDDRSTCGSPNTRRGTLTRMVGMNCSPRTPLHIAPQGWSATISSHGFPALLCCFLEVHQLSY